MLGRLCFPCFPFSPHLVMDFKTPLAQSSVSCSDPPFSFNTFGLFDFSTPFPMAITIQRLIAVPAACVLIIIVLTFAIRTSESRFGRTYRLKIIFSFLGLLNFEFPIVDGCSKKKLNKFYWNFREQLWFNGSEHMSQPLFWSFFGHWWCVLFTWVDFFISFSTINNSDCDTSSVTLAT